MSEGIRGRRGAAAMLAVLVSAVAAASAVGDSAEPPAPLVTGEPLEGATLVASSGDPTLEPDLLRWERCDPGPALCDGAGGHSDPEWTTIVSGHDLETYMLVGADVGHFVRVVAKFTSLGSKFAASAPVCPIEAAAAGPPPPPGSVPLPGGLPPPVAHQTANLDPLNGTILVNEPGPGGFRVVTEPEQIPLGSRVNSENGHVDVYTARNEEGVVQVAEFWAGTFKITQTEDGPLITKLKLVGPPGGGPADRRASVGGPAVVQERGGGKRRLWGRGRCRCRTGGRHSSGTVRGTWWLTVDRPDGTLTKVKKGKVRVRDFGLGETFTITTGERYLARAKRKR